MTATEELRHMLDERGVEHEGSDRSVRWRDRNGVMMQAFPLADGELGMDIWSCTPEQAIAATLGPSVEPPDPPIVPYDVLIDILRDEWGIEAMWDGLRRFWYVGLTEEGVRKRDENENLRELVRHLYTCMERQEPDGSLLCANCPYENESNECDYELRMEELGVDA